MPIRAAVMVAPHQPVEIREIEDPEIEPGSILLQTVASEVCGTDVHLSHGRLSGVPYPIIPGHVSVGRVLETGGEVRDFAGRNLEPGALVTFYDVHETCHACWFCLVAGQPNRCASRRVYGISYSADEGPLGGWAERIYLKPGVHAFALPESLSADEVIGGGCGLFTGFAAVDRAGLRIGDTVLVQGSGPVGLSAVAMAAIGGAALIINIGDPQDRLDLALRFGADVILSVSEDAPAERAARVRDLTGGRGVDVAIEVAGQPSAVAEGLDLLRDGGTFVIAGHYTDTGEIPLNPHLDVNRKHADIRGQWGTSLGHVDRALRTLARHRAGLPLSDIIGGRYPLEQANRALADVEAMRITKAIIEP
ncbi:MAG: zinc-binding dehydrogenase [Gemmatimonadota bacterium]